MTWTLFWQFVFLIAWTVFCVRVTWPQPNAHAEWPTGTDRLIYPSEEL